MHPTPFYVATMFSLVAAATAAVLQVRITNGTAVKQNELPFVGEIQLDVGNACTGFLIGPQTMMTAGPYAKIGGPYPQPNSKITAAGFGYIDGRGTALAKSLNKAELSVAGVEDCKGHYMTFNSTAQFCTSITQGCAICSGDSGGPLYVDVDGEPRVLGIVTLGIDAIWDRNGSRDYHIYITPFIPWVNKEIEKFEADQMNNATLSISGKD
ncbi:hypothetical protein BGZ67_008747 [Mortierella alpina]|nr:hypothetical protein BGZ67_008747 [Mortierella alpina]